MLGPLPEDIATLDAFELDLARARANMLVRIAPLQGQTVPASFLTFLDWLREARDRLGRT